MPAVSFRCPAGVIPIKDCIQACPRPQGRCLSLPTLVEVGWSREYSNKFSTTLLLMPLRQAYLSLTEPFAVNPQDRAFTLLGTRVHRRLEIVAKKLEQLKSEFAVKDSEINSTLDLLEPINGDTWRLVDFKCIGTYAIKKMLSDPPDYGTYDLQLNHYRCQIEKLGFHVTETFIQYIARDFTPRSQLEGVEKMALIRIPHYPDSEVLDYFDRQRELLEMALAHGKLPELCPDRWNNDGRCKSYCDVNSICSHGQLYIEAKKARDNAKNNS